MGRYMRPIGATWTTDEVLRELGDRLRQYRLQQNRTVAALARDAGVGVRTIVRLEAGEHPTLETVIQVLRALGRLDALEAMIPRPTVSPLQLVKLAGKERVRASGSRRKRALGTTDG
jgi:transcriptional regulator with XRE-family HTH domain